KDLQAGAADRAIREVHVTIPSALRTLAEPMNIPEAPALHPVPRVMDFQTIDLNGDGTIDPQEERMAEFAMQSYFYQRRVNRTRVLPYLRSHIRHASDSPVAGEREGVHALRRLMSGDRLEDERALRGLQDLVLNATTE